MIELLSVVMNDSELLAPVSIHGSSGCLSLPF